MINVYVVWAYDGPIMTTLLQFEESPEQREAMSLWSTDMWVLQAADAEGIALEGSYELAAIFEAKEVQFIY